MGQIEGTILIVDNSKVLSVSEEGIDALTIYSDNRSLVNNFGSLFEALWVENEILQDLVKSKNELLKSKEQLKIHDRMQKEIINVAAHELRTPVQPILGMADLIESRFVEGKETSEVSKGDLQIVIRNARRLEKLSSDILSVIRIESKSLHLQKTEFNLSEVILDVMNDASNQALLDKGLRLDYIPSNIKVEADREAISQVDQTFSATLLNLQNRASFQFQKAFKTAAKMLPSPSKIPAAA